jgi:hypothetical protein
MMHDSLLNARLFDRRRNFDKWLVLGQLHDELLSGLWFVADAEDFFPFSKCSGV